jgi:hypothetical protein
VSPSICKKLAISSPTSGGRSIGKVRSRTQTTEFFLYVMLIKHYVADEDGGILRELLLQFRNIFFFCFIGKKNWD